MFSEEAYRFYYYPHDSQSRFDLKGFYMYLFGGGAKLRNLLGGALRPPSPNIPRYRFAGLESLSGGAPPPEFPEALDAAI